MARTRPLHRDAGVTAFFVTDPHKVWDLGIGSYASGGRGRQASLTHPLDAPKNGSVRFERLPRPG